MTEVLKALEQLNVSWEKIGPYKMKCRSDVGILGHHGGMVINYVVLFKVQVVILIILIYVAFRFK